MTVTPKATEPEIRPIMTPEQNMQGRRVIITGSNRGIGLATAEGLASRGAEIVFCCRTREKGQHGADIVRKSTGSNALHAMACDLGSLDSIRSFCREYKTRFDSLHVLISNAAVLPENRDETEDGFEAQWGINHLAPFLMTGLLLDRLIASSPSRIITVSSSAERRHSINFADLNSEKSYDKIEAYAQSKRAEIMFTYELAERLKDTEVTANCLHPGVIKTGLNMEYSGEPRSKGITEGITDETRNGAQTSIYLASSPEVADVSGIFFKHKKPAESSPETYDRAKRQKLWEISEQQVDFSYESVFSSVSGS
jgi:NAD(P)-dependent dehydrogenase (short-subunit alcohol dehydrogenase family)